MNDRIDKLYKEVILKESKAPFHFAKPGSYQYCIESRNPFCGDNYELYINLNETDISSIHFSGNGCSISKASHAFLLRQISGLSMQKAVSKCQSFIDFIRSDVNEIPEGLMPELEAFLGVREFPGRLTCVIKGWESMLIFLRNHQSD